MKDKKYLEIIKEENLVENAATIGAYLQEKLDGLQMKYPAMLSNARGKGLYCAIDLPSGELRSKAVGKIFEKNVILLGSGDRSIRFRPALNIRKENIDEGIDVIESVVKEL